MDINPYAPATPLQQHEIATETSGRPIRFGGVVRRADVARYGYSRIGTVVAAMLLIIGALTCAFTALGLALSVVTSSVKAGQVAVSFVVVGVMVFLLVLPPIWLLSRFRGMAFARLLEKWSPRIVGPVEGKIEAQTLELVYPGSRTVAPLQSLTGVRTSSQYIALTCDHRQMQLCVLPRHLFDPDDFQLVTQRLASWAAERPLSPKGGNRLDARLRSEPLEMMPVPSDAITFSGTLHFSDLASTPVYRQQLRTVYLFFTKLAAIAVVVMLLIAAAFWAQQQFVYTFVGATLGMLLFTIAGWAISFRRNTPSREHPIANISGWLSPQGLVYNSAIGSSEFQLDAFERIDTDEHSIQLILPGHFKQAVLLVERMFGSAEDFQRVRLELTDAGTSAPAGQCSET